MSITRRVFLVAACAAAPLLAALPALAADTTVNVSLWDNPNMDMVDNLGYGMGGDMSKANMGIKLSQAEVPAGNVTFKVTNESESLVHEMVVSPIKQEGKPLPMSDAEGGVDEDAAGHLGEVSELDPGKSGALTLDLAAGKYILFCNVPGHYLGGMWTVLTVK